MPKSQKPRKPYRVKNLTPLQKQFNEFKLNVTHDIMLVAGALQDLHNRLLALEPKKESDNEERNAADPAPAGVDIHNAETTGQD